MLTDKEIIDSIFNKESDAISKIEEIQYLINKQKDNPNIGNLRDGYHSFNELYEYRKLYNAAFFNELVKNNICKVHKSKKHSDGEECFGGGWFIVMADLPTGQISNHYELRDWDLFKCREQEYADKWDGHTPEDVITRINEYLKSTKRLYTLEYSLGDPSDYGGHGKCERHFAKSNYSPKEISKAYKSATELLGFDFVKEIAAEYMDSSISCKYTGKLLKHGILKPSDFEYSEEEWKEYIDSISENGSFDYEDLNEDFYGLDQDTFVDIFVKIIKLILPDFELTEIITPTDGYLSELEGAGYGLFM